MATETTTTPPATGKTPEQVMAEYKKSKNKELLKYTLYALGFFGAIWGLSKLL